jgi:hypothetical protein
MAPKHDHVGVHGDAKLVYVIIAERQKFDDIPLSVHYCDDRVHGNGHVLSKVATAPELVVIFQYWLADLALTENGG